MVHGQSALEIMGINQKFWQDKRVFLTGHTGFKGGWLALWLTDMGAQVFGYALPPPTEPSFFNVIDLPTRLSGNNLSDIRNAPALALAMQTAQADIVFHLAAQPLVRYSYKNPAETYEVNVMGTVNVMEAVHKTRSVKAVVNVTTDKCYENQEWCWPYRENEILGGFDPYSSSKSCSELVTSAYQRSFFHASGIALASARAGNVIGGGDWATDRLIPDILRAFDTKQMFVIRSPHAIRPWQHVLEPLSGYLMLAEKLYTEGLCFAEPWNFGPESTENRSVQWIVEALARHLPNTSWQSTTESQPHEANTLTLDSTKAKIRLNWHPQWNLGVAIEKTLSWHQAWKQGSNMTEYSLQQIRGYETKTERGT